LTWPVWVEQADFAVSDPSTYSKRVTFAGSDVGGIPCGGGEQLVSATLWRTCGRSYYPGGLLDDSRIAESMSNSDITVTPAGEADIDAVANLQFRSHTISFGEFARPEWVATREIGEYLEKWAEYIRDEEKDQTAFVARENGAIIGMVSVDGPTGNGEFGSFAHLNGMHVDPDRRGGGIGQLLMTAASDHIKSRGYRNTMLGCLESNTYARKFYEKSGWYAVHLSHQEPYGWTYIYQYDLALLCIRGR